MKIKKLINYITISMLACTFFISALTVARAEAEKSTEVDVHTYSYYGEDYDVTRFDSKETSNSVELGIESASGSLDYKVLGSYYDNGDSYADCSNGYVYRVSGATIKYMYNWVKEWGYDYAGLMAEAVNDSYTHQTVFFVAR